MGYLELIELQQQSYEKLIEQLDSLIKESFPNRLRIKPPRKEEQELSINVKEVQLLPSELSEDFCYIHRCPYMQHILLEMEVNGKEDTVLLGSIPALTSRGTLLYGATPVEQVEGGGGNKVSVLLDGTTPLRERVAVSQLLPHKVVFLARQVQEAESDEKQQKLVDEFYQKKPKQKATIKELMQMDTTCLDNYYFRGIGEYLQEAIKHALGRIRGYFRNFPLQSENDLESLFFPSLPSMFTKTVEKYLNGTNLIQLLDKTNPLAELSHKRKVTFCGKRSIVNLEGDKPERHIHKSQFKRLCPIETPESLKIGLNLHLALGAAREDSKLRSKRDESGDSLGPAASLIPFIQHDDPNRALMGCKNMKQALPLLTPETPLVKTGLEKEAARQSSWYIVAEKDGTITQLTDEEITIHYDKDERRYSLFAFPGVMPGTGSFYRLREDLVIRASVGGSVISVDQTEVSIGIESKQFVHKLQKDFTPSVQEGDQIERGQVIAYKKEVKAGEIIANGPAMSNGELALGVNLLVAYMPWYGFNFEDAIVISERVARERLLTSLHLSQADGRFELKEKDVQIGDKLSNRHGHKGVIAKIEKEENMPTVLKADGTPYQRKDGSPLRVDVLLNPHGVISRMNIGQLYETHWGWIAWKDGKSIVASPFSKEFSWERLPEGKLKVRWKDPFNSEEQEAEVVVGWQYLMKLNHIAEDKFHVRGAPEGKRGRTLVTLQPPKGKRLEGGQRIGEMEVWALQAHQADAILEEILTVKSDALSKGLKKNTELCPLPEAFRALVMYLRGMTINLRIIVQSENGKEQEFPIDEFRKPFEPTKFVRIEIKFADNEQVKRWAKEEVFDPSYWKLRYKCQECNYAVWSGEWKEKGGKPGPRRCPKCSSSQVDVKLRWSPDGLFSEKVFGKKSSDERRERMGYIELAEPIPHPLHPDLKLQCLPVIPPDYRPMVGHSEGLNAHYRRVLIYNSILENTEKDKVSKSTRKRLIEATAQLFGMKAVFKDDLVDFKNLTANEHHDNLRTRLEGKKGLIRGYLLGKRVDFSGRAVIVPDPTLPFGACRLPYHAAEDFYFALRGSSDLSDEALCSVVESTIQNYPVILNRAPTLHRYNMQAFTPILWDEKVIAIHPLICGGYNADFDGDAMSFHLPLSEEAKKEAQDRLSAFQNLFSVAHGGVILHITQDIVAGIYLKTLSLEGREWLAELLEQPSLACEDKPFDKKKLQRAIENYLRSHWGNEDERKEALKQIDELMREAFRTVTENGVSFSINDLWILRLTRKEREKVRLNLPEELEDQMLRQKCGEKLHEKLEKNQNNPVAILVLSGARGNPEQIARLCAAVTAKSSHCYVEGLEENEYFEAAQESRPDIVQKKIGPALGGELTRKLIYGCYPLRIVNNKCDDEEGLELPKDFFEHLEGRVAAWGVNGILKKGEVITLDHIKKLCKQRNLRIFSPVTCKAKDGICARCYGYDLSTGAFPKIGLPVGILAAQSIGERGTQEAMRAFHGMRTEISSAIGRIKRLLEYGKLDAEALEYGSLDEGVLEILRRLMEVKEYKNVNLRHFEVVLHQMKQEQGKNRWQFRGLIEVAKNRAESSFLSAAAFQAVTNTLVEAAKAEGYDEGKVQPTPLLLGKRR